ncbi:MULTISPECIES: metallophosphoesterase [Lactobacillaceae]|uniref:metallophosphoesterase n=1 Tax=Lactobacillaceae TaxID=33958 RepID=UPI0014563BBA|nr:metallophosphoesterase [Lactobacillus sp. HBUAS51381]NLR08616.1 serine/threonine protein phosphatase [Lactobacillus sp. HBUAS51381]
MSTIYAMSDIHGCLEALEEALDRIHLGKSDRLIFIGDYVDEGDQSFQVLNKIMHLEEQYPKQVVVLLGNHDEWLCNWLFPVESAVDSPATIVDFKTIKSFFNESELLEIVKASQALQATGGGDDGLDELIRQKVLQTTRAKAVCHWLKKKITAKRYDECQNQIFVHAGIDEEAGEYWKQGTLDNIFTNKFPATTGKFYKDIVSGHINSAEVANDQSYLGLVYWDRYNHFFIDGNTMVSGVVPVLKYDTETMHYSSFKKRNGSWKEYRIK